MNPSKIHLINQGKLERKRNLFLQEDLGSHARQNETKEERMDSDLKKWKVNGLKEEVEKRGLDTNGLKAALITRLQDARKEEGKEISSKGQHHGQSESNELLAIDKEEGQEEKALSSRGR